MRGLKLPRYTTKNEVVVVAPYMGAWIETQIERLLKDGIWSHPIWVRGLKRSKLAGAKYVCKVAPYMGAWIETCL